MTYHLSLDTMRSISLKALGELLCQKESQSQYSPPSLVVQSMAMMPHHTCIALLTFSTSSLTEVMMAWVSSSTGLASEENPPNIIQWDVDISMVWRLRSPVYVKVKDAGMGVASLVKDQGYIRSYQEHRSWSTASHLGVHLCEAFRSVDFDHFHIGM